MSADLWQASRPSTPTTSRPWYRAGVSDRLPEEMPSDWRVKEFAHERGFGVLVHETGEEANFSIDVWDVGAWKPTRKEAAMLGQSTPALPQPGEPVSVRWKTSRLGRTVPALVQPTSRVSSARKEYKLSAWLKGLQKEGVFVGLEPAKLISALAKLDEDNAEEWRDGEPRDASDFAFLLMDLAAVHEVDPKWAEAHAGCLYSDDWRWDRDAAREKMPVILGLDAAPAPGGDDESLPAYVKRCNESAAEARVELRLHEVALDGDAHVFIAMKPQSFTRLVDQQYLAVDE